MTRLVIFDLDGTLLDTVADLAAACNHALQMCECPLHTHEEYKLLIGGGIRKLFWGALPENKRPSACIGCRSCEGVCPQNIKISEAMQDFATKLKG